MHAATGTHARSWLWRLVTHGVCMAPKLSAPFMSPALPAPDPSLLRVKGLCADWLPHPSQLPTRARKVPGEGSRQACPHLLHIVACLRAGLDEHHTQFFGPLFAFLDGYLPAREGERERSGGQEATPGRSRGGHVRLRTVGRASPEDRLPTQGVSARVPALVCLVRRWHLGTEDPSLFPYFSRVF